MIYLDNAATTFPKPPEVLARMFEDYTRAGVSPGRGSYDLALEAEDIVQGTRRKLARLFGAPDPERVVFASNATDALNLAFYGLLKPGDHVVSTRLEHNSVLRPLHHFRQRGLIDYDLAGFDGAGFVDPEDIGRLVKPNTRMVVVNHVSNVIGTVQPLEAIGRVCRERGVPFVVDASQSAGLVPVDMDAWHIQALAFTGHKSLYGPTGIGGLAVHPDLDVATSRFGGTGADSKNPVHTQTYPYRLEAGTLNLLGIMGLSAGLDFIAGRGQERIRAQEMRLAARLRDGLREMRHVAMYCANDLVNHVAVLSLNITDKNPSDVGAILDADFEIAVRTGLHCAPLVHEDLGTGPGAVRFSLGACNTEADIDRAIEAVASIVP